jgi:hypothetical protein
MAEGSDGMANKEIPGVPLAEEFPQYPIDAKTEERLERDFTYHPVLPGQQPRYVLLRDAARQLAYQIVAYTPPSREQSLALTKLEEAIMHANAAIARNEKKQ